MPRKKLKLDPLKFVAENATVTFVIVTVVSCAILFLPLLIF